MQRSLIFDNTIEGFEKLLTQVRAVQVAQDLPKAVFGLEPTANYHKPLGEHLVKCGRMVVLVSGVAVKRNRELLDGRWDKHDTKDASNIADLISQGKCLFQNRKQVLKLAGLDLSADRSGKTSDTATPVISKKGKADLRYALYH